MAVINTKLFAGGFNGVTVVDDNDHFVGIVTAIDILKTMQKGKTLKTMIAKDTMTFNSYVVIKDTPINDVIDVMIEKGVVMVPVVGDNTNKTIGVVSGSDIITEWLKERLTP